MKHLLEQLKDEAVNYVKEKNFNHCLIHFKTESFFDEIEYQSEIHIIENGTKTKDYPYYQSCEVHKQLESLIGEFIVELNNDVMTLYSELEHKNIESVHGEALLNAFYHSLLPHLEKDIDYVYGITTGRKKGSNSYPSQAAEYQNGEEIQRTSKVNLLNNSFAYEGMLIRLYSKTFPLNSEVDVKYNKDKGISVNITNEKDLLSRMRNEMLSYLKREGAESLVTEVDLKTFLKTKDKYDIQSEEYMKVDGVIQSNGYVPIKRIALLSNKLSHPFKQIKIIVTEENFTVMADLPMASLNIKALTDEEEEEVTAETVFVYLESGNGDKIAKALEVVKKDVVLKETAEKRYLPFMKAHLNRNVSLDDLLEVKEVMKRDKLGKYFISRYANVKDNYVSFAMLYDHECKEIVDFIGSTVKVCIDIDEVIGLMKKAYDEKDMKTFKLLFKTYGDTYKDYLISLRETGPVTWLTECVEVLLNLTLEKVMFDHTDFYKAAKSSVLREFVFALHLLTAGGLYIDVFQSSPVDLTEVFWLYLDTPILSFIESEECIPKSPFERQRELNNII